MDYVTRQLVVLTKKLREEVRNYQETLHRDLMRLSDGFNNLKDSVDSHNQTEAERNEIKPTVAISNLRTDVPIGVNTYAQRSTKEKIWGLTKGILEVAVAIAVVGYTVISFETWEETADAVNFSARQAELSRKSFNEGTKNFRADQRSWVGAKGYYFPLKIEPHMHLNAHYLQINAGKSPALEVRNRVGFGVMTVKLTEQIADAELRKASPGNRYTLFPQQELSSAGDAFVTINKGWLEQIRVKKAWLYYFGDVRYRDEFGSAHRTTFCSIWNADSGQFEYCQIFNDAQ